MSSLSKDSFNATLAENYAVLQDWGHDIMTNPKLSTAERLNWLSQIREVGGKPEAQQALFEKYGNDLGYTQAAPAPSQAVTAQPAPSGDPSQGPRSVTAAIRYDAQGRPIRNDYMSITGQDGTLLNQYQVGSKIGDSITVDPTALNAIQSRATSIGPSAWATLAKQKSALDQNNQIDKSNQQSVASQNQQYSQLASHGGLTEGARERLAMQAGRNQFQGAQGIRNSGLMNGYNIDLQDQQQKDQMLQQLPGMQLNQANFDQSQRAYKNSAMDLDNQRAMKDVTGQNAYNSDAYNQAMAAWGADKTADAQKAAASSGGGKK